ncbi:putative peptidoglycan glycosyltransferase FtsW [Dactylosporangium sp. NPDC050588]|uniref:FtsW/RodA/SpoVE family cell cycle protein n=1 Tax=Dactylosporangium sp. NPDC050588 TaxID=3157211 RepID=UPI0033CC8864
MRGDGEQDTSAATASVPPAAAASVPPAPAGQAAVPAPPGSGLLGWFDALRGLLDRPLASYYLLLSSVGLLVFIGLAMVFSVTGIEGVAETGDPFGPVFKQTIFAVVGLVVFWVCQRLPVRTFRAIAVPLLISAFALMAFVDLMGWLAASRTPPGEKVKPIHLGPIWAEDLWLHLGGIQVQPAELAKVALVVWGADLLVRKGRTILSWRELFMPLLPVTVALLLLVGYNDLGSMICLVVLFTGLLWAAGARLPVFAWLGGLAVAGVLALILLPAEKDYRLARIKVFFDPSIDPEAQNGRYQYLRGLWAIGNGGWFGVGLGESQLKWGRLPNAHNDFIFAIVAEELGVVGCLVVLVLFGMLTYTGLRIARRVEDPFRRLAAAAITIWFVGQAIINIGGVVGLMPITGLPLPFISDGGTALVVALGAAGMLSSAARAEPDCARAMHARPPRKWVRLLWAPLPPLPRARADSDGDVPSTRATGRPLTPQGGSPGRTRGRSS